MADQSTFADKVNELVAKATDNGKGAMVLTDEALKEVPEELAYAAQTELRYRNTQSQFTRTNQELKKVSKVKDQLTNHLTETVTLHLTKEQKAELNDLKVTDPEAWRAKLNEHEQNARAVLQSKLAEFEQTGEQLSELEIRQAKLASFVETTGIELNDDIIANQLPASYTKQLAEGKINFDEFLTKAQDFLTKGKVIKGAAKDGKVDDDIDMSKLPGSSKPSDEAVKGDVVTRYQKAIF